MTTRESWGRFPKTHSEIFDFIWQHQLPSFESNKCYLPYGLGRSYGDSCLNDGGVLVDCSAMNKIISFDSQKGVIKAQAGLSIDELLNVIVPKGWFVPVTPGTRFVTLGGAVANDVHGKNHHVAGTFGRHVKSLCLLRSSGQKVSCSLDSNTDLFKATVAGLGLTGIILWVELQLKPIKSALIDYEAEKFTCLDEFFHISAGSSEKFEYTVAWLDCVSTGKDFGRGIFMRGNHSEFGDLKASPPPALAIPLDAPSFALNKFSVMAFNTLYYAKQRERLVKKFLPYGPFFYPLDAVKHWNRIYGKRGFFQFQCVVPKGDHLDPIKKLLTKIVASGQGSFLAVLKEFGDLSSPGMLSFPRAGVTLCLDFANNGASTVELLKSLDQMTADFGGALYPAKDALMNPSNFKKYFPAWQEFSKYTDPLFSSSFWRRVTT